jgi:hypothetical protein
MDIEERLLERGIGDLWRILREIEEQRSLLFDFMGF